MEISSFISSMAAVTQFLARFLAQGKVVKTNCYGGTGWLSCNLLQQ